MLQVSAWDVVGPQAISFQWAPTLGGECYWCASALPAGVVSSRFNGHPPLGVNATFGRRKHIRRVREFQWAPTLGGECYALLCAPTGTKTPDSFNGHPPLGVNATRGSGGTTMTLKEIAFQWAPTLGGECYMQAVIPPTASGYSQR